MTRVSSPPGLELRQDLHFEPMETVLRTAAIYFALLVIFRFAGKRSIAEITTFDFILLLIISEATQQALVGSDHSITNALLVIVTLVLFEIGLSYLKEYWGAADRLLEGYPLVVVENGRPLAERMKKSRIDVDDVLSAAREKQGLSRLDQVQFAVLEKSGGISIIPKEEAR